MQKAQHAHAKAADRVALSVSFTYGCFSHAANSSRSALLHFVKPSAHMSSVGVQRMDFSFTPECSECPPYSALLRGPWILGANCVIEGLAVRDLKLRQTEGCAMGRFCLEDLGQGDVDVVGPVHSVIA